MRNAINLYAIPDLPLVKGGEDIAQLISTAAAVNGFVLETNDVVVIAQKIVSKAEQAVVKLADITPSPFALELAQQTGRDPRLCQVYIDESEAILSTKGRMVITKHRLGFTCSGAGVDRSNIAPQEEEMVVLLPRDPDASARNIREGIRNFTGKNVACIINDSFGRAEREGSIGTAIGIAGIAALEKRNQLDLFGNPSSSQIALIDEIAGAASLLMGQADEKFPVVIVRGVQYRADNNASLKQILISS